MKRAVDAGFRGKLPAFINNLTHLSTKAPYFYGDACLSRFFAYIFALIHRLSNSKKQSDMNKAELIDAMAEKAGLSKADAKRALDAFIDTTAGALKKKDRVSLVGFGSFSVSTRAARKGRNPQTGKEITIKAKNVVKFKPGAELSAKV